MEGQTNKQTIQNRNVSTDFDRNIKSLLSGKQD